MLNTSSETLISSGKQAVETELNAVSDILNRIDDSFAEACRLILQCKGRIVVSGMGKSGHIGKKIAATLASTGTPSFFVHPGEASHGDLGMITGDDVVLAISNSGNTSEIVTLIPLFKRMGAPLISMTGDKKSTLAREANVSLDVSVSKEACPLGLAPTASTTATLVMGDAIAVALLEARGFNEEDFAFSHPGGSLGRRLLLKVEDIMHTGERIPSVPSGTSLSDALIEISEKGLGMTAVKDNQDNLLGIFTDGDLRRTLDRGINFRETVIDDVMTKDCKTIQANILAAAALGMMEQNKISGVMVVDDQHQVVGALHMHDLLRAGVI